MADDPVFDDGSSRDVETQLIAGLWTDYDNDDEIDVATRDVLDSYRLQCTDALSEHPPNIRKARLLTVIAFGHLDRRPDS